MSDGLMLRGMVACGLLLLTAAATMSAQLQIGKEIVTRSGALRATLKLDRPVRGHGRLKLTWTDSYGRVVAVADSDVSVAGGELPIELPLGRAVALQNFIQAELTVGETVVRAPPAEFIVTPEPAKWDDYQIIMYYPYRPAQQPRLRDVGITAGKVASAAALSGDGGKVWIEHDYRFYCDQISTFFYAAYHTPAENPKHRQLLLAKELYKKDRSSREALCRKPCFHDSKALAEAVDRLRKAVRAQKRFKPFFYAHCDEAGVADLVTAWDFCFDERTLAEMRKWLIEQYGSLEGVNGQWGTSFKRLADVTPLTTDEMMTRGDDNLSPWADHRFFMNKTFADVLQAGTDAVLAEDPDTYVGLVGCQMPSAFGGYDYWLLSQAMTCIEPYNIGNNREIWRSLAPGKPATTTAFGVGDMEIWRLWRQMLVGDLGIIIYDEKNRYLKADGGATKLGASIAPTYRELTGGIRKQLAHMDRVDDPIAIHYSQASITAHWMFEARGEGPNWLGRGSSAERKQSDFLRLRETCTKLIEDNLLQYSFAAYGQLENGLFDKMGHKVMILPQSIALSKAECDALRRFVERGGTLIADCRTGLMDSHCKMLADGRLDDLFGIQRKDLKFAPGAPGLERCEGAAADWPCPAALEVATAEPGVAALPGATALYRDKAGVPAVIVRKVGKGRTVYLNAVVTDYHRWRLLPPQGDDLRDLMSGIFATAGIACQYPIVTADGQRPHGVEVQTFQGGDLRILAIHRNYQLRVSELGPPKYQTQTALEADRDLKVDLGGVCAVYDQRSGQYLGRKRYVTLELPTHEPVLLAVLPERVKELTIDAPAEARPGELVTASLKLVAPKVGRAHAFRVSVTGPDGKELTMLTQTIAAPKGAAEWAFPLAACDPEGTYTLQARDLATGVGATHKLKVNAGTMP